MKTILITGATGFVGSALALQFLSERHKVIALSRNDTDGSRTKKAITHAAEGFSLPAEAIDFDLLDVINIDFQKLDLLSVNENFKTTDEVWHCAAEMTYNPQKLEKSLKQNLTHTHQLYRTVAEKTKCKKFYYVSTAYTAGMEKSTATETLHLDPVLINPYQVSKWSAEMSLEKASEVYKLPVCIFRPSVVVGHEQTGWHGNSQFGFYSFIKGLCYAKYLWGNKIQVPLHPSAEANVVPINYVCEQALQLSQREASTAQFEIFQSVATQSLTIDHFAQLISEELGLNIELGAPKNKMSHLILQQIEKNNTFANLKIDFSTTKMRAALGENYKEFIMTPPVIRHLIQKYLQSHQHQFKNHPRHSSLKVFLLRLRHLLTFGRA